MEYLKYCMNILQVFANNGSGFEGLGDGTTFWKYNDRNSNTFRRYISMILMVIVGYSLYKNNLSLLMHQHLNR